MHISNMPIRWAIKKFIMNTFVMPQYCSLSKLMIQKFYSFYTFFLISLTLKSSKRRINLNPSQKRQKSARSITRNARSRTKFDFMYCPRIYHIFVKFRSLRFFLQVALINISRLMEKTLRICKILKGLLFYSSSEKKSAIP